MWAYVVIKVNYLNNNNKGLIKGVSQAQSLYAHTVLMFVFTTGVQAFNTSGQIHISN